MKSTVPTKTGKLRLPDRSWRLQDAKARLSEVVREAQIHGPQRVTLHGRDAVVVVRADEFDRMQRPVTGREIARAFQASPLADVAFERNSVLSPVRNIDL
ncbi:MAG: type II toxin-antitoxin system Phd/YefM family antitoxin [Hyphomicrobiales bacterium]|jgi:prevent-host-death family protein|nr:type II toxin-antitoxin system Phd/YefM family antitoxin [Hyphomicrobiales bacterium]